MSGMQAGSFDTFATRNRFYGTQFGGQWRFGRNNFTFDLTLKVASGAMLEDVSILGGSTALLPSGLVWIVRADFCARIEFGRPFANQVCDHPADVAGSRLLRDRKHPITARL